MIKLEENTPKIYYSQSRDFQLIGRLYDIVLNSVKTNADLIYNINNTKLIDNQMLNLLAMSLGFKVTRNYNADQLRSICACLPYIMKNKGNIRAVRIACNAILSAESIDDPMDYGYSNGQLTLYIPVALTDTSLLEDLMVYLLPAGISYTIVKELKETVSAITELVVEDVVRLYGDINRTAGVKSNYPETLSQITNTENLGVVDLADVSGMLANDTIYKPEAYDGSELGSAESAINYENYTNDTDTEEAK